MKRIIKQSALMLAAIAMVLGLAVGPVSAEHGSDDSGSGSSSNGSSDDDSGSGTTTETVHVTSTTLSSSQPVTDSESSDDNSGSGSGKLHGKAKKLLTDLRQKGKEHSQEARQKACTQRQNSIDHRTAAYASAAGRHLDTFNKIFAKVQAFHDNKHLNVTDYNTLVAAATAKQVTAQSAVDALKALDVTIDCTQSDPASAVATVKAAVQNARTALKDYRTAIKNVVVALKGASTAQDKTSTDTSATTGGDQ
jgi:hypothetical protein